jgi:16S rRNA (cytidine1402-2'-O)-methyltransferase
MGRLHIVSTPIGNLEDVTLRALRVLREADLVFAEDTRRTRILLDRHALAARPRSLHAHNEAARTGEVLAALSAGRSVALVSDAGTPLVSDPGARLIAAAVAAGHTVVSIPGPSAVLAALTVSGLPGDGFTFLGFLPRRASLRRERLERFREAPETLILFESPRRLSATLLELQDALGDRLACVGRELTKLHEEAARGTLSELALRFRAGTRGEVTIVVAGAGHEKARARAKAGEPHPGSLDERIHVLLAEGRSPREISATLAKTFAARRREVYARAVQAAARRSNP